MIRPSGTVTFLFTDIQGSTRRWEADPDAMRAALTAHDEVLRSAVEAHGGWLFKHTGDGVIAAFSSARAAVDAAAAAQRALGLPVRMGVATGEAQERDGDYFGAVLNRAARVMGAGHGGQILVAASTASLVEGVDFADLGEHRLRDLSSAARLFQVRAEGLAERFPPLRTLDTVPGNLPSQATSFIGRDVEVKEVCELVRDHRLVTLTGVGGVGKTRLALQVAAELITEFPDGVWLVELAPLGDPAALPDVVATVLGVTPQAAALTVAESITQALSGRRLLLVLDNCEHVLDAAADLVEAILARTTTVKVLVTSREGLRVGAEQLWPVPSLGVVGGRGSAAVELFVERARAVSPGFGLAEESDVRAVVDICRRVDGIALAIELAAARMVSLSAVEVLEHLRDRFRLLSGSRRGLERHQTLRNTVAWSCDLLNGEERSVLGRCSVFADGFDLAAAKQLCGGEDLDEYAVLDVLDSLVRKSLVTADQPGGRTRYGMLETIRQFAEEKLAATGSTTAVRDGHARYFANQAVTYWDIFEGPSQRVALDWVDAEFGNLRAGFRWATDQQNLDDAVAIAAHTTIMAWVLQRFEPVGWAEELLEAATAADSRQLPRLYTAASFCVLMGRPETAVGYAHTAVLLQADPRYDPFEIGWSSLFEATAHLNAGRAERSLEILAVLSTEPGFAHVASLCGTLYWLPVVGRVEQARAIAEETLTAARALGNPFFVAWALAGFGRAFTATDPTRALGVLRQGLLDADAHRLPFMAAVIARDAAGLEAIHGDLQQGLTLFDSTIDSWHKAGSVTSLAITIGNLVVFFDRVERPEIAAIIYGSSAHHPAINGVVNLPAVVDHLCVVLGQTVFDGCVATGAAMESGAAVRYARDQIQAVRSELGVLS